jgi:AbrB family looped-hinge helix DNA binding protein
MKKEAKARINANGCVVIPAAFRKALGMNIGDEVLLRIQDDELQITTQRNRIRRAQRRARRYVKVRKSLVEELLAERRQATKSDIPQSRHSSR